MTVEEEPDVAIHMNLYWSGVARQSCANTIGGWVWYCDVHDTHGNADSEDEAEAISDAHVMFYELLAEESGDSDEECDVYIVKAGDD